MHCYAQKQNTTPVPILKQINRHNEDGSYSYGYEAADGSFKIETKAANGEVKGKYGYIDDGGNLREIAYGANKNGFQPSGDGINVAPPTFDNNGESVYAPLETGDLDDGQYREDPLMYNDPRYNSKPSNPTQFRVNKFPAQAVQQPTYKVAHTPTQQSFYNEPNIQTERPYYQSRFTEAPAQNYYHPDPQQNYYRPSKIYNKQPDPVNIFQGHPATNLDLSTGSYSVTYG